MEYWLIVNTGPGSYEVGPFTTERQAERAAQLAAYRGWIWVADESTLLTDDVIINIIVVERPTTP